MAIKSGQYSPLPGGSLSNQQSAYRSRVYGVGGRPSGRSGQQVKNDITGEMEDQPGIFQGGTSNRRAGLADGGVVGSPNLGSVSELLRWSRQVPGGSDYLRSLGMMPEVSMWGPPAPGGGTKQGNARGWGAQLPGELQSVASGANSQQFMNNYNQAHAGTAPQMAGFSGMAPVGRITPSAFREGWRDGPNGRFNLNFQGAPAGQPGQGQGNILGIPGLGGAGGAIPGAGGSGNDLGGFLEAKLKGFMANPSGITPEIETNMRTRAQETVAGLQGDAMNRARADAVRRGASTSAGGDADIRDQLNRVAATGSQQQIRAGQDIDRLIADLTRTGTLGGLSAGNTLHGLNLGDTRSIRELLVAANALQQQQGPLSMLPFLMAGN